LTSPNIICPKASLLIEIEKLKNYIANLKQEGNHLKEKKLKYQVMRELLPSILPSMKRLQNSLKKRIECPIQDQNCCNIVGKLKIYLILHRRTLRLKKRLMKSRMCYLSQRKMKMQKKRRENRLK
jgi:hypothetical protein